MVIGALRHPKILIPAGPESSWQLNGAAEAAAPSKLPTQLFFRKLRSHAVIIPTEQVLVNCGFGAATFPVTGI